jgi:PAS domain S-box-containing protein
METPFNVLSIEDSDLDFEIISEQLIKAGYNLNIARAENEREFTDLIHHQSFDIILADYNLPQFDAFEALKICQASCPDVPFICVSGSIGEMKAIELLKKGAVDYVIKDRIERLPFAVKRALEDTKEKIVRRQMEESLKQSEERLRDIMFSTMDWVWEVDKNGCYTYSSQRDIDLFDVAPDEIIGKTPFDFMAPEEAERTAAVFSEIAAQKKPIKDFENWNIGKDGKRICLLTNGVPVLDKDGQLLGYRGVDKNITEKKLAEQELIKAKEKAEESDRLKTAFLSNMSHEIRTPLNSIIGFSDLLLDPFFEPDQQREFVETIKRSGNNLIAIINDIMDIAKIETGQITVQKNNFSVTQLFRNIGFEQSHLINKKGLEIKINIPDQDVIINADEVRIKQILLNFINNSIKFSDSGVIEIGFILAENTVQLYVKDSGIGIPKEFHEKIFERFRQIEPSHTRKYGGMGLGLSISKHLAELMGGDIALESEPGKGSTFSLIFRSILKQEVLQLMPFIVTVGMAL